jgi:YD repeat-containing protein
MADIHNYREAIVNAVMHRDYLGQSGDVLVEVFRNKIIVSNPGGLVKFIYALEINQTEELEIFSEENLDIEKEDVSDVLGPTILVKNSAGGKVESLDYDPLNRLIKKNSSGEAITYIYDTNINGTLWRISTQDYNKTFGYDQRLRKINETTQIDGRIFNNKWGYDSMDRVTSETLPDNYVISYTYNLQNQLKSISNVVSDVKYNAVNKPTEISYNNNLKTNLSYNPNTFRVERIKTGNHQDLTYSYDSVGNVIWINDSISSVNKRMAYDKLDRLISFELLSGAQIVNAFTYNYGATGNIIEILGFENLKYYYSHPVHAVRKIVKHYS